MNNNIIKAIPTTAGEYSKNIINNQMLLGNNAKEMKMLNLIKKHSLLTLIICLLLVITVIVLLYLSMNKNREEDYVEIFHDNKKVFEELSSSLMSLEHGMSIFEESGKIIVRKNGNNTELSEYFRDEETKSNIERAIRDLGIRSIGKINGYLEFTYYSKKDSYSIVYATNKNQLNSYTQIQNLEDNWYYRFIFQE